MLKLDYQDMNDGEQRTYDVLRVSWGKLTLADLTAAVYPNGDPIKGNWQVRNHLRRLVKAKLVRKVARGTYALRQERSARAQQADAKDAAIARRRFKENGAAPSKLIGGAELETRFKEMDCNSERTPTSEAYAKLGRKGGQRTRELIALGKKQLEREREAGA